MSTASTPRGRSMMLRGFALVCLAAAALSLGMVGNAAAEVNFGFESASAEESTSLAGAHPDLTLNFALNQDGAGRSEGRLEELAIDLPPGLIGNPQSFPTCQIGFFNAFGDCPTDSQVGVVKVEPSEIPEHTEPLFNLEPTGKNEVARLGFIAVFYPIIIDVNVRSGSDYGVTATIHDASGKAALVSSSATIWGVPADPVHDELRMNTFEAVVCGTACTAPEGKRPSGLIPPPPKPFLSNPTACEQQPIHLRATSYQVPGKVFEESTQLPDTTECERLSFQPRLQLNTTSARAGAPTGLTASLRIPQNDSATLPATSAMRAAKVTLPEGMTINSSAADGLEACSDGQVGVGTEAESHCPDAAKLGTATFVSPALPEPLHGSIYQRTPAPGNQFRIWLVTDEYGIHLKLPGEIHANSTTGQLTTEFNETPQLPVEEIQLDFKGGERAPLKNPESCGFYSASYRFTPWSDPSAPVSGETQPIEINQGCAGSGFSPKLEAGAVNPVAGSYSPLVVDLKREDGEENISSFDLTLPKGELAKLKGVPLCPDADAVSGGCPASSQIGSVAVAAGAGSQPLWVPQPGKAPTGVFLAGPYKGAPYSVVTKVPAQAGPFDLGTVSVRSGLYVDPNTVQATVRTDPLPQMLEGVPITYRQIHVSIDRPKFAVAPTNCREQEVSSTVASTGGAIAHPDDRFQVGDCAALKFAPSLALRLKGATERAGYPALTAVLKTHGKEANLGRVSVALPHSEFLAQEHIKTICTRVEFAEDKCPPGSVYGRARAISPLLDDPLEGPVYLRSSNNPLPDLVVALHGQLDVNLVGRIDSVRGGIRTTFDEIPDAPVTRFVLKMNGGRKSLLVNSTNICAGKHRATVKMRGQNGKHSNPHPLVTSGCGR